MSFEDEFALTEATYDRVKSKYANKSEKFILKERTFNRQYASVYAARLKLMSPLIKAAAHKKWGKKVPIVKLSDLSEDTQSIVIGTLFKVMELQPSILKEISEDHNVLPQPHRNHFTDNTDELVLEDDVQRLALCGNIDVHSHVTGAGVALLGRVIEGGKFDVEDVCYAGMPEQLEYPALSEDKFLVLISGVGLAHKADSLIPFNLFVDYVSGYLGCDRDQQRASRVARVVIAGNTLLQNQDKDAGLKTKFSSRKEPSANAAAARLMDDLLTQLSSSVYVDVMPGESDPSNYLLPQQPMHSCLFPRASRSASLQCVSNPYEMEVDGIRVLGTSGQNVADIQRYSRISDTLDVMEWTLRWRHLAPTAPDTLSCYPFYDEDPFVIERCPHVYFAGGQEEFASRLVEGSDGQNILLVSVPKFSKTFSCVWVNLSNMSCEQMVYEVYL